MNEIDLVKKEFDYSILDPQTTDFLKQKESVMSEIVGKAYTELGRELKEAHGELSKRGYGCFEEWYTSLGFKKQSVYNYMNRFELIVQQLDKRDMIEEMPSNLVYEISKPSVDPNLKQQVLDGEITTNKQFKQLEQKLKQTESERVRLENLTITQQQELNKERSKPALVDTESLKRIAELEQQIGREHQLAKENISLMLDKTRMERELAEHITKRDKETQAYADLRKSLRSIINLVTMEHSNATQNYSLISGHKDAHEAVQDFIKRFDPLVQSIFQTWREAATIAGKEMIVDVGQKGSDDSRFIEITSGEG